MTKQFCTGEWSDEASSSLPEAPGFWQSLWVWPSVPVLLGDGTEAKAVQEHKKSNQGLGTAAAGAALPELRRR